MSEKAGKREAAVVCIQSSLLVSRKIPSGFRYAIVNNSRGVF